MRRLAFVAFYDSQGRVDDYVPYFLERLRPHVERVVVTSNSALEPGARATLEKVADEVWERDNVGFDAYAHREAMARFGWDRLVEYDEVLLLNTTFFGPVTSFDDLFARFEGEDADFWGITDHPEVEEGKRVRRRDQHAPHVQSYWVSFRRPVLASPAFRAYWERMPRIVDWGDAVRSFEARLTPYFVEHGFTWKVAYPAERYGVENATLEAPLQLLRDGCPIVKRRTFFHDPLYFEERSITVREVFDEVVARGYPAELMLADLARTSKPRDLVTNLALLEVLPHVDLGYDTSSSSPLRLAVVAHVFYPEMADEILDRLASLPEHDLVVTTSDVVKRETILAAFARRGVAGEVRVVASNRGRDISAYLVDCADVLTPGRYDVVLKVHSKRSPQDGVTRGEMFKRHLWDNLLPSPGYAANVLRLFQQHPGLGVVMPPVVHNGYPTLGHAWFANRDPAKAEAERLGIAVPFDESTPVATYGSMFFARPEALRPLVEAGYRHDDFPDEGGYVDGALTHVVERLFAYASLSQGMHVREVLSPELAAVDYRLLEFRAIEVSAVVDGGSREQVLYLGRRAINPVRRLARWIADRSPRAQRVVLRLRDLIR